MLNSPPAKPSLSYVNPLLSRRRSLPSLARPCSPHIKGAGCGEPRAETARVRLISLRLQGPWERLPALVAGLVIGLVVSLTTSRPLTCGEKRRRKQRKEMRKCLLVKRPIWSHLHGKATFSIIHFHSSDVYDLYDLCAGWPTRALLPSYAERQVVWPGGWTGPERTVRRFWCWDGFII